MIKNKNEQIINENYNNIYRIASSLSMTYGLPFEALEDLQKVGYVSLIEQHKNFDESNGISFWNYAYNGVRLKMLEEIRFLCDTVSISEHLNKQLGKVRKICAENVERSTNEQISLISNLMNISTNKATELLILSQKRKTSIDEYRSMLDSDDFVCDGQLDKKLLSDILNPEEIIIENEQKQIAEGLTDKLDEILSLRQAEYIRMYYGIGCDTQTFAQIGEEFCVSAATVEKSVKAALKKLKEHLS